MASKRVSSPALRMRRDRKPPDVAQMATMEISRMTAVGALREQERDKATER